VIDEIASDRELELGDPYLPGGPCAWVAPARRACDEELALKVGWRHREAEHEADALRFWDGDGAVRCLATRSLEDSTALLLERCTPGHQLSSVPEPEQDEIIGGLLRRLWARAPQDGHPFASLEEMCGLWADWFELHYATDSRGLNPGLAREGIAMLSQLPATADSQVLLCTDLHAGNVLAARREPWLVIDPKLFIGDPAFDPVQHMLNGDERLADDQVALTRRMAVGTPLGQLAGVSDVAALLRARVDELLDHFVDAARAGRGQLERDRLHAGDQQAGRPRAIRDIDRLTNYQAIY
jgi:streptomycin 6-kinase